MSRSVPKVIASVVASVAAGGFIGWFALRLIRAQIAKNASATPATTPTPVPNSIADLVPDNVFTDEEPTALEAALRDAVTAEEAAASDVAPDETAWIGNTRTLVLHRADSSFLPSEEHRQYFHSEDEAISAGYRRAANE